jgi:hypothetical protein
LRNASQRDLDTVQIGLVIAWIETGVIDAVLLKFLYGNRHVVSQPIRFHAFLLGETMRSSTITTLQRNK